MAHPGIVFLDENTRHTASQGPQQRPRRCCAGRNTFGVLGCLFSILGVFTFGLASPLGLGFSLLGMTRAPRGAATFGLLLGAVGSAFLALWGWGMVAAINAMEHEQQQTQTEVVLERSVERIEIYRSEHKELPEGINGNKLLIAAEMNDAWGQSLRYDPIDETSYLIRSAGPDGKFDTGDDLTSQ